MSKLEKKLAELPKSPGVYLYKNKSGQIIYVGKAAVLRDRVRQYFQKGRPQDTKTTALVAEIVDLDWITVESELDALFLEAELIRRYRPHYNILLRDDKSTAYIRINYHDPHPTVTITRRPLDDKADYFGPYFTASNVRRALQYLRRVFPYSTHAASIPRRACLQYHLGLCPGLEENKTTLSDYRATLKKLMAYLRGERAKLVKQIEREMNQAAKAQDFEKATHLRNQLFALKGLTKQIIFSDKEFMDLARDEGLAGLTNILGLIKQPARIEGYDISHMSGTDTVASMVVFTNGLPNKASYRKFKMRLPGNDDFAHMREALTRRLRESHQKGWGLPDLFLIDGGKGQLAAALDARDQAGLNIPIIGLAKREEEIVIDQQRSGVIVNKQMLSAINAKVTNSSTFTLIGLDHSHPTVKLLQRIRDESHRFAVSYHSTLKAKRQTASLLDDISGIGPVTRKKLLKAFGSMKGIIQASNTELERVVGASRSKSLMSYIKAYKGKDS